MLGGLTASTLSDGTITHRTLPVAPLVIVVAVPEIDHYTETTRALMPERVPLTDALANLSRMPLLLEALRGGDLKLLASAVEDNLRAPLLHKHIPGYGHVVEMAKRSGAAVVTLASDGPALVAFAEKHHKQIADAMQTAFQNAGVRARTWTLNTDTQGIVLSVAQSA
jgi:homoserine kinase